MLTSGNVNSLRLRQIAQNAGIPLLELPPRLSLRPHPTPHITRDDAALADRLLAQETLARQKEKHLIRTKKRIDDHSFKIATGALSRLVQENGQAGVAQCLLQVGSLDAVRDGKSRREQIGLRRGIIKS